jgi:drug/metabolite transporter (DMT)-like permease
LLYALIAAALFGAAVPLSKAILRSGWGELLLAGTLYLSSGLGLLSLRLVFKAGDPLRRDDLKWLLPVILFGGIAAPVALMYGLTFTTGYAGALLLNLETVFTAALAFTVFREKVSARDKLLIGVLIVGACVVGAGTANDKESPRPILGALLVAAACFGWGLDNNFTQKISDRDPLQIASIKGLVAGTVNLIIGYIVGQSPPFAFGSIAIAAAIGLLSYGASLALFVLALRKVGSSRTSALFATSAVSGVLVAWLILGEQPQWSVFLGGAIMVTAVIVMALPTSPRSDGSVSK